MKHNSSEKQKAPGEDTEHDEPARPGRDLVPVAAPSLAVSHREMELDEAPSAGPAEAAAAVAELMRGSAQSVLQGMELIARAYRQFDEVGRRQFLSGLETGRVIARGEAKLGAAKKSTLSKYIAIGEAEELRAKEIAEFLTPRTSTLYQMTVLLKLLPKDKKLEQLLRVLKRCPGAITREFLERETKKLKDRDRQEKEPAAPPPRSNDEPPPLENEQPMTTLKGVVESGDQFDVVVLTPYTRELKLIGDDYEGGLETYLPLHLVTEQSKNAAVVIVGPSALIVLVAERLLTACGFGKPAKMHVLVGGPRANANITESDMILVAEKGRMKVVLPANGATLDYGVHAIAIASQLYPEAKRKLHVFAEEATAGWTCVSLHDSWVEKPSVS